MNIQQESSTDTTIVFQLHFDSDIITLQKNARIILNIFEENLIKNKEGKVDQTYEKLLNMVLKMPFKKQLKISELSPSKLYKFNFILENGQDIIQKNIYGSTRMKEDQLLDVDEYLEEFAYSRKKASEVKGLCQTEDILYKAAIANDVSKHAFKDDKELLKKLIDARKATNTSNYINQSYKFAKPNANKMERLQRTLMVAQGIELYENIYGFREDNEKRNGFQFGQNDWFMGPFYSYDANSIQMKQTQISKLTKDSQNLQNNSQQQSFKSSQGIQRSSIHPQNKAQIQQSYQSKTFTQSKMKF